MHYKDSEAILQSIKAAKRILINCHIHPDADSAGSALGLAKALKNILKKDIKVISRDEVSEGLSFLKGRESICVIDYEKFDFDQYDLFISLDSSDWKMVVGRDCELPQPKIKMVVIDHHVSNKGYGDINLVDSKAGAVAEVLYLLFEDWNIKIDDTIAYNLLAGVISDTGCFRYDNASSRTMKIAAELVEKGGNKSEINYYLFQNVEFKTWELWKTVFEKAKFEKETGILWAALSYSEYVSVGSPQDISVAGLFFQDVKDSKIGIYMEEREKGKLSVNFRSRTNIDVSKIAAKLGGGGHFRAAGSNIYGMKFEDAVDKVLEIARKYVK